MLYTVMTADPLMRLRRSKFRQNFGLSEFEKKRIREIGIDIVQDSIREIVQKKLSNPLIDGKQTPYSGNPIYVAMHATATCCRKCLFKWHRISPWHELCEQDINYTVDVIYRWIRRELLR